MLRAFYSPSRCSAYFKLRFKAAEETRGAQATHGNTAAIALISGFLFIGLSVCRVLKSIIYCTN